VRERESAHTHTLCRPPAQEVNGGEAAKWQIDPERQEAEFQLGPLNISNVWHRIAVVCLEAKDFQEAEVLFTPPPFPSHVISRHGWTLENEATTFADSNPIKPQELFEKSLAIRQRIVGDQDILCKKSRVWLRRCRRERATAAAVSDALISRHLCSFTLPPPR
jgi:hypothetical protein